MREWITWAIKTLKELGVSTAGILSLLAMVTGFCIGHFYCQSKAVGCLETYKIETEGYQKVLMAVAKLTEASLSSESQEARKMAISVAKEIIRELRENLGKGREVYEQRVKLLELVSLGVSPAYAGKPSLKARKIQMKRWQEYMQLRQELNQFRQQHQMQQQIPRFKLPAAPKEILDELKQPTVRVTLSREERRDGKESKEGKGDQPGRSTGGTEGTTAPTQRPSWWAPERFHHSPSGEQQRGSETDEDSGDPARVEEGDSGDVGEDGGVHP